MKHTENYCAFSPSVKVTLLLLLSDTLVCQSPSSVSLPCPVVTHWPAEWPPMQRTLTVMENKQCMVGAFWESMRES